MKEILIVKEIIQYLNYSGHAVFMNEISGMPDQRNASGFRKLRGNKASADIIGTLKGGQACFIEVKRDDDKNLRSKVMRIWEAHKTVGYCVTNSKQEAHIAEQSEFLVWQAKAGAFAMFAFSLDCVIEGLKRNESKRK